MQTKPDGLYSQEYFQAGMFIESSTDSIVAHAGGGQASATALSTQTNRIITAATAGDSVVLPPSVAGMEILVMNHGANPVQVFGSGTDTIDDIASGTGVSQMANSFVLYACATAGQWYTEGLANGYAGGLQTISSQDGIVAAGSTQGTATVLQPRMAYNVVTTAAATGVLLPASIAGAEIAVANNGANALLIYPATGDKINALAINAGLSAAAATIVILYCFTAGQWYSK